MRHINGLSSMPTIEQPDNDLIELSGHLRNPLLALSLSLSLRRFGLSLVRLRFSITFITFSRSAIPKCRFRSGFSSSRFFFLCLSLFRRKTLRTGKVKVFSCPIIIDDCPRNIFCLLVHLGSAHVRFYFAVCWLLAAWDSWVVYIIFGLRCHVFFLFSCSIKHTSFW